MNGSQLLAEPLEDFGALVVTAPPWRLRHFVSSRMYLLVLRNPRDPARGLTLTMNASYDVIRETARGILAELGATDPAMPAVLNDPAIYDSLSSDPALLTAIADAVSQSEPSGMQQLLGIDPATSPVVNEAAASSSSSGSAAQAAPTATARGASQPEDEVGECPICYEEIHPGDAAMRCSGEGGVHHYFHSNCLQGWMRARRSSGGASCPVCRGRLQFNGQRLQEFLQGAGSATLGAEERSFLQEVADGLRGRSGWSDMSNLEKAAYAGGILAAAGWGFMLGYTDRNHRASNILAVQSIPQEHQIAQGVGWCAGILVRIIREVLKDKKEDRRDRS